MSPDRVSDPVNTPPAPGAPPALCHWEWGSSRGPRGVESHKICPSVTGLFLWTGGSEHHPRRFSVLPAHSVFLWWEVLRTESSWLSFPLSLSTGFWLGCLGCGEGASLPGEGNGDQTCSEAPWAAVGWEKVGQERPPGACQQDVPFARTPEKEAYLQKPVSVHSPLGGFPRSASTPGSWFPSHSECEDWVASREG